MSEPKLERLTDEELSDVAYDIMRPRLIISPQLAHKLERLVVEVRATRLSAEDVEALKTIRGVVKGYDRRWRDAAVALLDRLIGRSAP